MYNIRLVFDNFEHTDCIWFFEFKFSSIITPQYFVHAFLWSSHRSIYTGPHTDTHTKILSHKHTHECAYTYSRIIVCVRLISSYLRALWSLLSLCVSLCRRVDNWPVLVPFKCLIFGIIAGAIFFMLVLVLILVLVLVLFCCCCCCCCCCCYCLCYCCYCFC